MGAKLFPILGEELRGCRGEYLELSEMEVTEGGKKLHNMDIDEF
jgi:hypothetical protein